MKKLFTALFLLTVSLLLCACGGALEDTVSEPERTLADVLQVNAMRTEAPLKERDPQLQAYTDALACLDKGRIEAAYALFLTIRDYRDVSSYLARFSYQPEAVIYQGNDHASTSRYRYDEYGRVVESCSFSSFSDTLRYHWYFYDEKGNLIREEEGPKKYYPSNSEWYYGSGTSYVYDTDGNLILMKYPGGYERSAEYDDKGNLIYSRYGSVLEEIFVDTFCTYNEDGKLIREERVDGTDTDVIMYTYNEKGELVEEACRSTRRANYSVRYEYDRVGRLVKRSHFTADRETPYYVWSWEYDQSGMLLKETCESGTEGFILETLYSYDRNGRCVVYRQKKNGTLKAVVSREFDESGNLISEVTEYPDHPEDNAERRYYGYQLYYDPLTPKALPDSFLPEG
ncbi:MAG: hypothetical protein IKC63_01090 [Clostridia bacterium]|nr:hypothetical protein [Clostridia bacterium]